MSELFNLIISHHKDLAFALDDIPVWGGPAWVQGAADIIAVASRTYIRSGESSTALRSHNGHGLDTLGPVLQDLLEDIDRLSDIAFSGEDTMPATGWRTGTVLTSEELRCALDAATASSERCVDWTVLDRFLGTMQHIASGMLSSSVSWCWRGLSLICSQLERHGARASSRHCEVVWVCD